MPLTRTAVRRRRHRPPRRRTYPYPADYTRTTLERTFYIGSTRRLERLGAARLLDADCRTAAAAGACRGRIRAWQWLGRLIRRRAARQGSPVRKRKAGEAGLQFSLVRKRNRRGFGEER
ncbi:hypothetical protein ACQJBY_015785 [Aegilops geniculata]